jgi:hypothetical protein
LRGYWSTLLRLLSAILCNFFLFFGQSK